MPYYLFKYFSLTSLKVGPTYGRKVMKGYLAQKYKGNISQKRVANALKTAAPNYYARRQTDTARQTNTIPYRADYFGHKLHVDQNEKLEMYGVVHVAAIDGRSHYITCGATMPRKSNKVIYAAVYRFILVFFLFIKLYCLKNCYI